MHNLSNETRPIENRSLHGRNNRRNREVALHDNGRVQSHVFRVVIEEGRFEDGKIAYHAFRPASKGCHTWGHSPEEALANIREAAELYVEDLTEEAVIERATDCDPGPRRPGV